MRYRHRNFTRVTSVSLSTSDTDSWVYIEMCTSKISANTRRSSGVGVMLTHRLRRWPKNHWDNAACSLRWRKSTFDFNLELPAVGDGHCCGDQRQSRGTDSKSCAKHQICHAHCKKKIIINPYNAGIFLYTMENKGLFSILNHHKCLS